MIIIPVGNFSRNRSCHFFHCLDCVEFDAVTKEEFARATERDLGSFGPCFHVLVILCIYLAGPDTLPHSLSGDKLPGDKRSIREPRDDESRAARHPDDDDDTSGVTRCRFRGLDRRRGYENRGDVPA